MDWFFIIITPLAIVGLIALYNTLGDNQCPL